MEYNPKIHDYCRTCSAQGSIPAGEVQGEFIFVNCSTCKGKGFVRKKIDKKRTVSSTRRKYKKSRKEKLRSKCKDGYPLWYVLKSGTRAGMSVKQIIDYDLIYMESLLRQSFFKLDADAMKYYTNKRRENEEKRRKAREERERERRERAKRYQYQNRYSSFTWDSFDDFFSDFFKKYNTSSGRRSYKQNHQHDTNRYSTSQVREKEYGKVLEFSGQVKKNEIKGYYRRACLKWHPDKHECATEAEKAKANQMFRLVQEAWDFFKTLYNLT